MDKTNDENKTIDISQPEEQPRKEKLGSKEKPKPKPNQNDAPVRMGGGVCC